MSANNRSDSELMGRRRFLPLAAASVFYVMLTVVCWRAIDRFGLLGRTYPVRVIGSVAIVLTSDHGEEFAERGDYWFGHTKTLYQELLHVPLIVKPAEIL